MKNTRYLHFCALVILFLLSFFIHRNWFQEGIHISGESHYFSNEFLSGFVSWPYLWSSVVDGGGSNLILLSRHFIRMLLGLLAFILPASSATIIFLGIPCIILPCITMYWFAQTLFKRPLISFFSAFLFSFNSYLLILHQGGQPYISIAVSLMPLALHFYIKALENRKFKDALYAGLMFALVLSFDTRYAYLLGWCFLFYIPFSICQKGEMVRHIVVTKITLAAVSLLIPVLLHFYWILPLICQKEMPVFGNFNQPSWVAALSFSKIQHSMAMKTHFWGRLPEYNVSPVNSVFWIIPIFVIAGTVSKIKHKQIWYFLLIGAIGVILAKGANPPFVNLYKQLFVFLPGFSAFRDSSKLYTLVAMGYAPLFGVGIVFIADQLKNISSRIKYGYVVVIFALCVLFVYPDMRDQMKGGSFEPKKITQQSLKNREFILQHSNGYHTLQYPRVGTFSFFSEQFPYYGNSATFNPFDTFYFRKDWNPDVLRQTNYLGSILGFLNIKYIVLQYAYPTLTDKAVIDLKAELLKQNEIVNTDNNFILENRIVQPRFYMVDKTTMVLGGFKAGFKLLKEDPYFFYKKNLINIETIFNGRFYEYLKRTDEILFFQQDWNDLVLSPFVQENSIEIFKHADWAGDNELNTTWNRTTVPPHGNPSENNGSLAYAKNGVILCTMGEASLTTRLSILESGEYEIWVRALHAPLMGSIKITLDSEESVEKFQKRDDTAYRWQYYGTHHLKPSQKIDIKAVGNGQHVLDQVIVVKKDKRIEAAQKIYEMLKRKTVLVSNEQVKGIRKITVDPSEIFLTENSDQWYDAYSGSSFEQRKEDAANKPDVKWEKISPVKYQLRADFIAPGTLVFAQTFDPGWVLKQGDNIISGSHLVNGRLNGFEIKEVEGRFYTVEYAPQRFVWAGLYISLTTVAGIILFFIMVFLKKKRFVKG